MDERRDRGLFLPLMLGILVPLSLGVLFLFFIPVVDDPRPRKPVHGGWKTTVWDKWTWEREAERSRRSP